MEGVFLNLLGELEPRSARPPSNIKDFDARVSHLFLVYFVMLSDMEAIR